MWWHVIIINNRWEEFAASARRESTAASSVQLLIMFAKIVVRESTRYRTVRVARTPAQNVGKASTAKVLVQLSNRCASPVLLGNTVTNMERWAIPHALRA